jgi:hypothetical protein
MAVTVVDRRKTVINVLTFVALSLAILGTALAVTGQYLAAKPVLLAAVAVTGYAMLYVSIRL